MTLSFPLLLVIAMAVCGALALVDLVLFASHRRAAVSSYERQVNKPDPVVLKRLNKEPLLMEYGKLFSPVLFITLVLRSFLVEPFQISSGSMRPTFRVGDFILVNKFTYGIRLPMLSTEVIPVDDPQRGDVMVFRYPSKPNINYVKRVIGLPGDAMRYTREKRLYASDGLVAEKLIDKEPGTLDSVALYQERLGQAEHLIHKEMSRYHIGPDRQRTIPADHHFVMGDNRDSSNDSRYWNDPRIPKDLLGMVPDHNIISKVFTVWMSWPDPKMSNLPNFFRVGVIH